MNRKLINWMGLWGLGALISYHNEPSLMRRTSESSESLSQINAGLFWNRMTITVSRAGTSSEEYLMESMKRAFRLPYKLS